MRHRIFIAINLPENVKKSLIVYQSKWLELPCRWTKKENLHITLIFLGYLSDQELLEVLEITRKVASRNLAFSINLNKICYGPPKKIPPKMVWVETEKSKEFTQLRDDLEKSLMQTERVHPALSAKGRDRAFSPHITLGRIRVWEFRQIEPEEKPQIEEEISLSFKVNSIEVMESQLKRGGPDYTVLESAPLGTT
ncbi:MAG: RNA 2',3'-cyclic phosphodiesterase [Patescibacteria group bacterium]|nr:RNA 2',3'-cyclic phosphodiesterase [Patescibacteria group bacterium]